MYSLDTWLVYTIILLLFPLVLIPALKPQSSVVAMAASPSSASKLRSIRKILPAPRKHWVGDGFNVYPVFANMAFTKEPSPFIMFDYGAPKYFPPTTKRLGVGQHPHRGFETVTIAFQGEVEHADSNGGEGVIGPGDVQWMTAAKGILHEEFHSKQMAKDGGTLEMCQIWINLPAKHKMDPPRYQPILSGDIPAVPLIPAGTEIELFGLTKEEYNGLKATCEAPHNVDRRVVQLPDGKKITVKPSNMQGFEDYGRIKIIAGNHGGVKGPALTFTPIDLWDVLIKQVEIVFDLEIPAGHNTIVFVRKGAVKIGENSQAVGPQGVAMLDYDGTRVRLQATEPDTQVLVLSGEPIDEPIAARGPFVMNTQEELKQANSDFYNGILGRY